MTIEHTLITLLQGRGANVYPLVAPEKAAYPLIVYQRVSTAPIRSHAGAVMDRARFQVAIWSNKYEQVVEIAESIKDTVDLNTTDFELATRESELDSTDAEPG